MEASSFARWLNQELRRREWNQSDLAQKVGTSNSVVSRWVNGEAVPSTASCDRLADVLGFDVDYVLAKAGHRPDLSPEEATGYADLAAMLRRIRYDRRRERMLRDIIQNYLDEDREGLLSGEAINGAHAEGGRPLLSRSA